MSEPSPFDIIIEIPIQSPFKKSEKEGLVQQILTEIIKKGGEKSSLKDSYYLDRRGAEFGESAHFIFEVLSPYATWASLGIAVYLLIKKFKGGQVNIKTKNGKSIPIKDGMSAEDVLSEIEKNKDESSE